MEWAGVSDDFIPYNITRERGDAYAAGDYAYEFISWVGTAAEHLLMCNNGTFDIFTDWLQASRRAVNPMHVTYVRNPAMDDPESGLVGDHAYWVSGIQTRSGDQELGQIDVISDGFGRAQRERTEPGRRVDSVASDGFAIGLPETRAAVPANPFTRESRCCGRPAAAPKADRLRITARNIGAITIDPRRARVTCKAQLDVDTDGPLRVRLKGCRGTRTFG